MLIEINRFRLHYKIYEKLKAFASEDKQLIQALGTDILQRVELVSSILINADSFKAKIKAEGLGLKDVESYLKEETNPGIKKYRSVIKEYQRKYNGEIEVGGTSQNISELFKKYLRNSTKLGKELSKEETTMFYWMIEAANLRVDIKKEDLDMII